MASSATGRESRSWAPYVLTAVLVWVGWQVVQGVIIRRAPVDLAVRTAPTSALALSRAAEAEYVAERYDVAHDLAELALSIAPFDVRALRVLGLSIARTDEDAADPLVTLAGNWSLRDDPAHGWLTQRRLKQGDYAGAFAHADTLARRLERARPDVFKLFATAASLDPRSHPALLDRVSVKPNWRPDFLEYLRTAPEGPPVQAALALGLQGHAGALTDHELETIYGDWLRAGRIPGLLELRRRTGRPAPAALIDGGFDGVAAPAPFRWNLFTRPGVTPTLSEDPTRNGESALFIESDGFSTEQIASQLLTLAPGRAVLSYQARVEVGAPDPRLRWTLTCLESGVSLATQTIEAGDAWTPARVAFETPAENCTAQWLSLETTRGPRRTTVIAWIDDVRIVRGAGS